MSYAKMTVIGRLTRDPKISQMDTGEPVAHFSVACDTGYGQKKKTLFVSVTAFRHLADICRKYAVKGKQVYLEGTPSLHSYAKQGGEIMYEISIVADVVRLLGSKDDAPQRPQAPHRTQATQAPIGEYKLPERYDFFNEPSDAYYDDVPPPSEPKQRDLYQQDEPPF